MAAGTLLALRTRPPCSPYLAGRALVAGVGVSGGGHHHHDNGKKPVYVSTNIRLF